MSYTPQGSVDHAGSVEIRFDKPVVDEAMVGKAIAAGSVAIAPAIGWNGFWHDRQTLTIDPTAPLQPSTRYRVALTGDLARRTAGFSFAFVHEPLAVDGLVGVESDAVVPDAALPLHFNQPVRPADAAAHCQLTTDGSAGDAAGSAGARDIALATHDTAPAATVALVPARPLALGGRYTLRCAGLSGAGGDVALDPPYTLAVQARRGLEVTAVDPSGDDVAADQVTIALTFSTPVSLDAARKAVSSTPPIVNLDQGYLSGDGTGYQVTVDLETHTRSQLTVDGLVDTFGQKLARPAQFAFTTGDATPRLSMQRGIFAVEAGAKGYPVWSRNVGKLAIECAAIPRSKLVQLLTTDMNYDAWGGNDDDKPIGWAALGAAPKAATRTIAGRNQWQLSELDLGATCAGRPGARGVYLTEVTSDEIVPDPQRGWLTPRRNRVLANVTDLGVLLEVGTSSGLVWVTSLSTGAPLAGAKVSVFTPAGKQVASDTTGDDGLVRIRGSALLKQQKPAGDPADPEAQYDWDSYRSQRLIAIVERAGDLAIVDGNWSNGIQTWNFGVREDRSGGASKIRGFLQSDRGLYRPGEIVHFKGIAREVAQGRPPRVPAVAGKAPVALEITDSRGQVVMTGRAALSSFGGFGFDLALTADAALGDYYVAATLDGQVFRERFSVEEFRPASFELGLASGAASPRPGDPLAFHLEARYLFGAPVADAKVEWGLRRRNHPVRFDGWEQYTFSANPRYGWWYEPYGRRDDYGEPVSDGTGTTDAQGQLAIAAQDTATAFDGPVDYIVSATVTDTTDQAMTKSAVVTAHKTEFYLGMHANEFVQAVGMPFGVNLVALAPDGKRVATPAHLSFVRTVNRCSWQATGARSSYHCDASENIALERDIAIAAGGSHTERIYPTDPGEYVVKVEARDARGNPVVVASEIWVIGKGEAFWSGDEGARMTLVASKPSYQPGDTARLVAQANLVQPTALVTIERDGVIEARVQRLASATEGIALPISDAWAPNVFARIAMISGRHGAGDANRPQFKMGMVELTVATVKKQLDVAIELDRDKVRPGDRVTGKITVRHDGAPATAEVSLSAADEGVLQLIAYQTPNPMKTFYAPYGLGVDAGTNWNRIARLADPDAGDPDQGGDFASSNDAQRVRSKFVASAYWAPMLVTDEHGDIAFAFTAPDNLTAFRLMAVAADAGDRFGAGERRLTVDKPVMAAPALPRFLRGGDAATVGIVIHNHTDRAGKATVTARATGAALDRTSQVVDVPASGAVRVGFAATAADAAAASFEFAVALGDARDAVRVTLPIDRPRTLDHRLLVDRTLAKGDTWSGALGTPSDVLRDESTLTITVDRSGLGDLAPGLRALVEYPYGCLEQTLSRFIPLVAAKDLARVLDDPSLQGTRANQFIAAGIAKVLRHQQGDGLFSLWPQSQTYPHLAAYALWGLTVAADAGESVPRDAFDRGLPALAAWATSAPVRPDGDAATMAMAAYVMALRGKPDPALAARLYALRAALPRWGQAFLLRAMALARADAGELAELEKLIVSELTVAGGKATMRETLPGYDYELYMASDIRATAMALAALLEVDPRSPLIDPLVAGLRAARNIAGTWGTTQENLWSLVALAAYGKRAQPGAAGTANPVAITAGGKPLAARRSAGSDVQTVRARLADLAGDRIDIAATGTAHVTVRVTEARRDPGDATATGFTLTRSYLDASGDPATAFHAGDFVTVQLAVTA
ncbi:MAG TPA: MG2 domain-containing protein, partial [Kofleriaceae bacterium]|nr:MG2 domain-containing protein [Kofleriaceae bacterium]